MSVDLEKSSSHSPSSSEDGGSRGASASGAPVDATPTGSDSAARWKLDLRVIPTLSIMYLLNVWDQSAIDWTIKHSDTLFGTAAGSSNVYKGIFYLGFILFVLPTALLLPKLTAKILLPLLMVGWGTTTMIQAGVSSWAGLAAVQFFLGAFQAGFWASVVAYLATIYKRNEVGFRLALVFGFGMVLGSFNGPISVTAFDNSTSLAGWKVLMLVEGAITLAIAPLAFLLLPRATANSGTGDAEDEGVMATILKPSTFVYAVIGLFLGACASSSQTIMAQMIKTLATGDMPEAWDIVAINTFGFLILLLVAASSDFYFERSTHIAVPILCSLVTLVNLTTTYYINKRASSKYSSFVLAATVYISPVFHAWYMNNTKGINAKAAVAGIVVGAFQVGDALGWATFLTSSVTEKTSSSGSGGGMGGGMEARATKGSKKWTVDDFHGLEVTAAYMAIATVAIFAYGAWTKHQSRVSGRRGALGASVDAIVS